MPAVKIGVPVDGLKPMLDRIRALPKTAQNEIREASQAIADDEAARIRGAGARFGGLAARVAPTVKSRRDRIPAIVGGGAKRVGDDGKGRSGDLFFGAEFGGRGRRRTQQFLPHRGTEGYWFFAQLREDQDRMMERWMQVVDAIAREWEA